MGTTDQSICVRAATDADLGAVAEIFGYYVVNTVVTFEQQAPTVAAWRTRRKELRGRQMPFLVAERVGQVIGYAYAAPWRDKPAYRLTCEDTVYVAPDATGQGAGRALLAALLRDCKTTGRRQVIAVIADTGDVASQSLHGSLGFVAAGRLRQVGRKQERWIDTILMQRDLA